MGYDETVCFSDGLSVIESLNFNPVSIGKIKDIVNSCLKGLRHLTFFFFFKYFYCISSDFSDLPDMTDEYIDLSVYALTGWLLYILHLTYTKVKCMKMNKYI